MYYNQRLNYKTRLILIFQNKSQNKKIDIKLNIATGFFQLLYQHAFEAISIPSK